MAESGWVRLKANTEKHAGRGLPVVGVFFENLTVYRWFGVFVRNRFLVF
ncbi:hypothetical protein DFQ14_11687, partial [Halopolyspora algeriensis]